MVAGRCMPPKLSCYIVFLLVKKVLRWQMWRRCRRRTSLVICPLSCNIQKNQGAFSTEGQLDLWIKNPFVKTQSSYHLFPFEFSFISGQEHHSFSFVCGLQWNRRDEQGDRNPKALNHSEQVENDPVSGESVITACIGSAKSKFWDIWQSDNCFHI